MSATVKAADGRDVVLSPTGVAALTAAVKFGWVPREQVHAATRRKLEDAGLIVSGRRWHRDLTVIEGFLPTDAGIAAVKALAS